MTNTIMDTIIKFLITGALGYCLSQIKNYSKFLKKIKTLEKTQLSDMKNDLSNKFFVYDNLEEVEDYLVMSFREKCELYFELGGDSWIHPMYEKSSKWKVKLTGYLK